MHKLVINRRMVVLYYLLKFGQFESSEGIVSQRDTTPEAIARNLGLNCNHVSTALKELLNAGLVERKKLHVSGETKKKYVYRVTDKGAIAGKEFEAKIAKKRFFYKDQDSEGTATVPELAEKTGLKILDILASARDDKLNLDRARLHAQTASTTLRYLSQPFYGREQELIALSQFENSVSRTCIIHGMDGMGKTTLLRRAIAGYQKRTFVFEVRKHYSTTLEMFFQQFYRFLIEAKIAPRVPAVWDMEKLRKDLIADSRKLRIILAVDNFQDAEIQLKSFLVELAETLIPLEDGLKLILVSSERVSLNPLHIAQGKVLQIELEPLNYQHAARMLMNKGFSQEEAKKVYGLTHGIPALLEIATPGVEKHELTRDSMVEQMLGGLTSMEKAVLEAGSLFNNPFEPEAIFSVLGREAEIDYDMLDALHERFLLKKDIAGRYAVNDFVATAVSTRISEQKKRNYHLRIGKYYEKTGRRENLSVALYHMIASNDLKEVEEFITRNRYLLLNSRNLPVIEKMVAELLATLRAKNIISQFILLFYAEVLETMGLWKKAEAIYERLGDNPFACLKLAALLVRENAPVEKTRPLIEKARKMCKALQNHELLAEYHYIEGLHAEHQNNLGEAVEHYRTTLDICKKLHLPVVETYAWVGLARVSLFSGRISEAMDYIQRAEALMLITDGSIERALLNLAIAGVYRIMGNNGRDAEVYREALKYAMDAGEKRLIAAAYLGLSGSLIGSRDYSAAKEYFLKAEEMRAEINDWHMEFHLESQRLCFADTKEEAVNAVKRLAGLLANPVDLGFATRMTRWCLGVLEWKFGREMPEETKLLSDFLEKTKK
ncbi:MAG: AAA family ATPase [Thermoplasmata archaeon]|nr:AAA family ATPase [Thermoplasmata archaeon]